jgi:hypothetical protein
MIIGIITAVAGLLWALRSLQNSGFDLNSFNPYFWYRRHQWVKKYGQSPLYTLDNPMDVAAVLILAAAKLSGELTKEHKQSVLDIYQRDFKLDERRAQDLFASSSFLLQGEEDCVKNVDKILARSKDQFSAAQISSTINLIEKAAHCEGSPTVAQQQLIAAVTRVFVRTEKSSGTW